MKNAGLEEAQAGIKIAGRNINNLRYADDTTLMAESEEELKSLLMKVKEESEKACLKLNIQKTMIMASSPITSWQIDGETMEMVTDFLFLGSKITVDGDCSHEIKRRLFLGRKAMTNLDSMLNSYGTAPGLFGHTSCLISPLPFWGGPRCLPLPGSGLSGLPARMDGRRPEQSREGGRDWVEGYCLSPSLPPGHLLQLLPRPSRIPDPLLCSSSDFMPHFSPSTSRWS